MEEVFSVRDEGSLPWEIVWNPIAESFLLCIRVCFEKAGNVLVSLKMFKLLASLLYVIESFYNNSELVPSGTHYGKQRHAIMVLWTWTKEHFLS